MEDISALGLRHVGYEVPVELPRGGARFGRGTSFRKATVLGSPMCVGNPKRWSQPNAPESGATSWGWCTVGTPILTAAQCAKGVTDSQVTRAHHDEGCCGFCHPHLGVGAEGGRLLYDTTVDPFVNFDVA